MVLGGGGGNILKNLKICLNLLPLLLSAQTTGLLGAHLQNVWQDVTPHAQTQDPA